MRIGYKRDRHADLTPVKGERREERKNRVEKASDCSTVLRNLLPGQWSAPKQKLERNTVQGRDGPALYSCCAVRGWGQPGGAGEDSAGSKGATAGAISQLGFPELVAMKEV